MLIYLTMIDSQEDKEKFSRLYDLYNQLFYHIAFGCLHSNEDAEDAVQQTFLRIIKNLDRIAQVDSLQTRSYVCIICRYCCVDIIQKRVKNKEILLGDLDESVLQERIKDDFPLETFRRLKAPYRDILLLHYSHGYTVKEIAKLLDMRPETVKTYIHRGKIMYKALLERIVREDDANRTDR